VNISPITLEFKKRVCGIFAATWLQFGDRSTLAHWRFETNWNIAISITAGYPAMISVRSFVLSGVAVDCWQSFDVPSATAGFLWQGAKMRPSYRTAGPCHLLSAPATLTTPRHPQSKCDGLSHLKEDTGEPSVPAREFNLIACRNLTRHAGSSGRQAHAT